MNQYKSNISTIFLSILIVSIAIALLAIYRFDTIKHIPATNIQTGEFIQRGEIMEAQDEYAAFSLHDTTLFLAKNTQVKLVQSFENALDLQLIQGRVVVSGIASTHIRELEIKTDGTVSIIHYSWLDELEIAPMYGMTSVHYSNKNIGIEHEAIRMSTLEPYTIEPATFSPETSSEADFYIWVDEQ